VPRSDGFTTTDATSKPPCSNAGERSRSTATLKSSVMFERAVAISKRSASTLLALGRAHGLSGNNTAALTLLQRAYGERSHSLVFRAVDHRPPPLVVRGVVPRSVLPRSG
jgi:hypothetical protein